MSPELAGIIVAPIIVFMVIVLPIWLLLHYRSARKASTQISADDQQMMVRMIGLLEKMESRINTLEKILDAEDPRWRSNIPTADRL